MKYTVKPLGLNAQQVRDLLDITREYFPEYRYITIASSGMMMFLPLDDNDDIIHWLEFLTRHLLKRMFKPMVDAHGSAFLLTKISDLLMSKDPIKFIVDERAKLK